MNRICMLLPVILLSAVSFSQTKKAATPPPVIRLVSGQQFAIDDTHIALHQFSVMLRLSGKASKAQTLTLHLHAYDAPLTHPTLLGNKTEITIPKDLFSKIGGDTVIPIECSIDLATRDSMPHTEKVFLVKEGDEDNPFTVIIKAAAAKQHANSRKAASPQALVKKDTASGTTGSSASAGPQKTEESTEEKPDEPAAPTGNTAKPAPYTVTLTGADTSFNPMITGDILTRVYTIKLHFKANSKPTGDTLKIPVTLLPLTAAQVSPVLLNGSVNIYPVDWEHKDSNDNITKTVSVQLSSVKSFEHDVSFYLIQGDDKSTHAEVRITTIGLYNPNKPFWVEVGANFDFADGLKPNNFFGGVFLHKRDIRPIFSGINKGDANQRPRRLGLFAGVYESKTMSDVQTEDFAVLKYYNARSTLLQRPDSVGAFTDTGKIKQTQVVRSIGLFFSPQIRLTNGSANMDGLHVSASLWLELQWQRISNVVDYTGMARSDTFYVPTGTLDTSVRRLPTAIQQDIRTHYFGMGLPIFFKEGDANVFFNPVIGFSNQPTYQELSHFTDSSTRCWRGFYAFQFRLNEEHFGIAFTGEVRGLFYPGSKPLVSIALTKKFDLSKFLEFK